MNAVTVVGYAYDADLHCIDCTRTHADVGLLKREPPLQMGTDENGIAFDLIDGEGIRWRRRRRGFVLRRLRMQFDRRIARILRA